MDPASRRALWAILKACRAGRAMVLTTHFMEEADLLADTVAIMSEGRLLTAGSSLALKRHWSDGCKSELSAALAVYRHMYSV